MFNSNRLFLRQLNNLRLLLILAVMLLMVISVKAIPNAQDDIPETYQLVAENELFQLYVDAETLAFKLLDKRSGYLWHSGLDALADGDRLNSSWQAFAKSGLSIDYLDNRAGSRRVSITNSEHILEVTPLDQGIAAQVTFEEYGISVGITLQLEADGVRVEIPFTSISQENPEFRLGRVYLYPFLGATRGGSVPGYMLLPDGAGSLINFADSTNADNMFYGRYYGADLGIIGYSPYDPLVRQARPISFPVFGMSHNEEQAFFTVIEDGAAYGELQAHPAGILTNFNFLYNVFIYNETYFQATNRAGGGVTAIQRQINNFDVAMHYRFLTGETANYVGMAQGYQQYLVDNGVLHPQTVDNPQIGMRLEFLGGDKETVLLWDRFVPMTTLEQMRTILDGLQIPNPEVIYYGWQPYGATSMPPVRIALEGGLGNVDELRTLAEQVTANGGHFALYLNPQAGTWNESGYSQRYDLAMAITNVNLEGYNRYGNLYFTLPTIQDRYASLAADIQALGSVGFALDSIGSTLYSDFRSNTQLNRVGAIDAYQDLFAESPTRMSFYRPNDYLWGSTQAYYDMPMGDNGYIYTSGAVPFLPIVLAGYIPYYGTALNFSSNQQDDLLRHIEFGIYPSYFLTHEVTANMLNTGSNWIYTSSYEQWGEQIQQTYQWMNTLLAPVRSQEIIAHEALARDVFATTYANGQQIIVNYTNRPFTLNGVTVEARDAALMEARP